jgi:hydroxypyruvate reductase
MAVPHLVDSVGHVTPSMRGGVIVSGSHGGLSAAHFVAPLAPAFVVFNDAGVGRDGAGISGLPWLQARSIAACAVRHTSARIGDARSTLEDGIVSHVNDGAAALGVRPGMACREAVGRAQAAATLSRMKNNNDHATPEPRAFLRGLFEAAIASAQPALCVPPHLPDPASLQGGRLVVIGAGKASAAMAAAVEAHWQGPLSGTVVTRYGYAVPCRHIRIVEAAHPVPDAAGEAAARTLMDTVSGLTERDLVLALVSGGGSALLPMPAPGLTLEDKQAINRALLKSGATISEMNCVRRHLSRIKGGRLAAACHPARVLTLLLSDVPGDDPIDIASGPTVPDPTTREDARAIVRRFGIALPAAATAWLDSPESESIKPGDARLARIDTRMVATPQMALEAAAQRAREQGVVPYILSDAIEGEARDVGTVLAALARQVADRGQPLAAPCVLLSGGETTVTVRGQGRGGRNVECLLALAVALNGHPRIHALAGDTDGVDGLEEIAGAIATPDTLARAQALGLRARDRLAENDGHGFFEALGDSVVTGPTLTNVNDFRAILVAP